MGEAFLLLILLAYCVIMTYVLYHITIDASKDKDQTEKTTYWIVFWTGLGRTWRNNCWEHIRMESRNGWPDGCSAVGFRQTDWHWRT